MKPARQASRPLWWVDPALGLVILLGLAGLCWAVMGGFTYQWNISQPWKYRESFLQGWLLTIGLAAGSLVGSSLLGLALVVGQRSPWHSLRWLCRGFIELIRGTPLLVQLLVGYYLVARAFGLENKVLAGILLLSGFAGAYVAEILRGGIDSIESSQREAARALGFTPWQSWRHVILPQALPRIMPGLAGQFVSLIKDSSLLSVLGVGELAKKSDIIMSSTAAPLETYLPMALAYLILTLPISWLARWLEKRWQKK